jgi:hypothetical protein
MALVLIALLPCIIGYCSIGIDPWLFWESQVRHHPWLSIGVYCGLWLGIGVLWLELLGLGVLVIGWRVWWHVDRLPLITIETSLVLWLVLGIVLHRVAGKSVEIWVVLVWVGSGICGVVYV